MPANGRWRRLQGECNREIPPGETPVRVERCGKSAPAAWRLCRHEFRSNNANAILAGSDAQLKEYAQRYLGYTRDKGVDFLGRFNGKYIIGEAKFISDEGGHQNDQFLDAMTTLRSRTRDNVINVAILDGVLYIPSRKKMYTSITSENIPVFSALVLRDYVCQR